ncbi:MAG: WecB/TagA/CpsF family glycosyltransferase [Syntrophomonas sp.]
MKKIGKANILGCFIDLLDMKQALLKIEEIIKMGRPAQIITLNAEIVYKARNDEKLKKIINSASLVTPDGIGIVWAARWLGYKIGSRVTGIDMVYNLCQMAAQKGWKLYFFGAAPGMAEKAGERLQNQYPGLNICGYRNGYFNDEDVPGIIKKIKEASPHILLVALGAPKQEFFIEKYKKELGVPVCIGVGGSFDVLAGVKKRAPGIFIRLNLEWLYRLLAEPSRFRRQLALPRFAWLVIKSSWREKSSRNKV